MLTSQNIRESLILSDPRTVSLGEYVIERHSMFIRILNLAKEKKRISQSFYEHFMLEVFEPKSWEEAFELFEEFGRQITHAIQNSEYYILLERLEKGEKMIEQECDPVKKRQYQELYNRLKRQFERLNLEGEYDEKRVV